MMRQTFLKRTLTALVAAVVFTAAAGFGLLDAPDGAVSDRLYQRPAATDGEIVVVGMDRRALEELGPMPWPRDYIADAICYLNADPDYAPAVIAVDVLYVGESADSGADEYLAAAAADGGNVVVASAATFGSSIVTGADGFYMDTRAVLAWDEPFEALAAAADSGHINAMADADGIIRHTMNYIDVPGVGRVESLARTVYRRWAEVSGEAVLPFAGEERQFSYLPFTAAPGGYYDGVSVLDLIYGEADPEYFAGKIVLIGPYAAGMQDEYRTSIDHAAPMYGVEILANTIDACRAGKVYREANEALQLGIVFVVSAAALAWFYDRKLLHALIGWLGCCAVWVALCLGLFGAGIVLHVLWVPLAVTVLFIVTVAINYLRSQREKRRITATFGRYVDPAILKELLVQGGAAEQLGGTMREIAVLFVDIRGFTTMSEALDPPTVVEIINKYLTLTTECIMRHRGTLDKFVGDCTMAFWNAPLPQEDPVYLACCAAMDMVEGSKQLGEELMQRFGRTVSFGVGVHYGPAVVGNIGAPRRMDYTAIGDTVNTAARLEANAPAGTVYISRTVADLLGDRATVSSLGGTIKLKGKADGFEILTLDSLRQERNDSHET
ncbi:MAG: adenylate/guanylate cyclase domain-containing protein [Ruminococcaceae bacterium]|nr:adenylate/guanylate cyclase domain-containing protein [Oscillospiraceae bacterium]